VDGDPTGGRRLAGQGGRHVSKAEEELQQCEACGATVYPEHIKSGTADRWMGKLLCRHCLDEKRQIAAVNPAAALGDSEAAADDRPMTILLDDGDEAPAAHATEIAPFGGGHPASDKSGHGMPIPEGQFRRSLAPDSPYATRCRTFHTKLADSAVAHLNTMINEWVDASDDVRIKFATSSVGLVIGKSSQDLNLFITVFY
jgi:hypothetical protein